MKIATWNVNSLKIRLPQVLRWLQHYPVDVLCLQETKLIDSKFPIAEIRAAGYEVIFIGQNTYNGVAILSRYPIKKIVKNNPFFEDEQKRLLAVTINNIRIICVYVPNGQSLNSTQYEYKLKWLDALYHFLVQELNVNLVVLGDYNIAPEDLDVYDPLIFKKQILVSEKERAAFIKLQKLGLIDAFRLFKQSQTQYSWWDYRQLSFSLNKGLRIDHILLSSSLATKCSACFIDKTPRYWKRPSDHTPVIAIFNI